MLNKLISPGYLLIKSHLRHIAPNHNHFPICVIFPFIPQDSIFQVDKTIWLTSQITSYSSYKIGLKPTGKIMMRKWRISQKTSNQWSHQWCVILKFLSPHQTRSIHQRLSILPLWSWITRGSHHWKVEIIRKLVACGLSHIRSAHQSSINPHQDRNQSRHCSGPQDILQPHQYVSQCGE